MFPVLRFRAQFLPTQTDLSLGVEKKKEQLVRAIDAVTGWDIDTDTAVNTDSFFFLPELQNEMVTILVILVTVEPRYNEDPVIKKNI